MTKKLRLKSTATMPQPLVAHLRRDPGARPEAVPRPGKPLIDLGSEPDHRPGRVMIQAILGGPPPYEAEDAWPPEKILDWAVESAAWLRGLTGVPFHTIALHHGERSAHFHAVFPPYSLERKGRPRFS